MNTKRIDYYTLRFLHSDSLHKVGEQLVASEDIVRIGQQQDCDISVVNVSSYADEVFAIVRPCAHTKGWQLIPVSQYVQVKVNGSPVTLVHYLVDGDRIAFDDNNQELLFNVRNDGKYSTEMGIIKVSSPVSRKIMALLILLPIILFGILFYENRRMELEGKIQEMLLADEVKKSILQLSVDSVYYVEETSSGSRILRRFSYVETEGKAINGTAFLTTDGSLFTARHCIEPWLNDGEIIKGIPSMVKSIPTKWALEAETYNQTHHNDTIYKVVGLCTLSRGEHATEQFEGRWKSSDFIYDTTRDDIIELGDFDEECYWRSIRRQSSRSDMMFGDLAYMLFPMKGMITLPSDSDMRELVGEGNSLFFMGYPEYQIPGFEFSEGKVKRNYHAEEMLAHDGSLVHGYSGGPVLVVEDNDIYVVGVISVIDSKGGDRMYSVPITKRMRGGNINE